MALTFSSPDAAEHLTTHFQKEDESRRQEYKKVSKESVSVIDVRNSGGLNQGSDEQKVKTNVVGS